MEKMQHYYDQKFIMNFSQFKTLIEAYIKSNDASLRSLIYALLPDYREDDGYKGQDYKSLITIINSFAQTVMLAKEGSKSLEEKEKKEFLNEGLPKTIQHLGTRMEESLNKEIKHLFESYYKKNQGT